MSEEAYLIGPERRWTIWV